MQTINVVKGDLGFTGTQQGMTSRQILRIESWKDVFIARFERLHEGDCIGADERMVDIFRDHMIIIAHPPINEDKRAFAWYDEIREPKEDIPRNHDIVDESGLLIATPKEPEEVVRSGTWATVRYAANVGVRAIIIAPDGTYERRP